MYDLIKKHSEYDQEISQSQTADNPWHREEEPHNNHETPGRQTKQSNQLFLPHRDDCETRMDTKLRTTKHRTITESHNGSNNQQRINNNRATALERTSAEATGGGGELKCINWHQIPTLDFVVVEAKNVKLAWRIPNFCNKSS